MAGSTSKEYCVGRSLYTVILSKNSNVCLPGLAEFGSLCRSRPRSLCPAAPERSCAKLPDGLAKMAGRHDAQKENTMPDTTPSPVGGTPSKEELLTSRQVSELTGLTRNTLEQYRTQRRRGRDCGPDFVKQGYFVRYRQRDVDAWLSSKRES
jgi:predicted DNA-binding transcriptional regulator AlpA